MKKMNKNGFSLVELIIYTLVVGAFLLLVTQIFISVKTINTNSLVVVSLQTSFRGIMTEVTRTVRSAGEVTTPQPGQTAAVLVLDNGAVRYAVSPEGIFQKTVGGTTYDLTSPEATVSGLVVTNPVEATQSGTVHLRMDIGSFYQQGSPRAMADVLDFAVGVR